MPTPADAVLPATLLRRVATTLRAQGTGCGDPRSWRASPLPRLAPQRMSAPGSPNYLVSGLVVQSPIVHPLTASQGTFILKGRTCDAWPNRSNQT
jgi:hypothetical protein